MQQLSVLIKWISQTRMIESEKAINRGRKSRSAICILVQIAAMNTQARENTFPFLSSLTNINRFSLS